SVVPLQAREHLIVDVSARVRYRIGVLEDHLLCVAEERARRVVAKERLELLRRDAIPAADGSIDVLSELAAVPRGDAPVEQRPQRGRHALRLLLEGRPHRLRGAEVRRIARVEQVRIERRAPELLLLRERLAQVVRERFDVDRRDTRLALEHGHLQLWPIGASPRSYIRNGRTGRCALRRRSNYRRSESLGAFPAVAWSGGVDTQRLAETAPSERGDEDGLTAFHPFDPAEIEAAPGDRGPYRTGEVWAPLGPIQAESAVA